MKNYFLAFFLFSCCFGHLPASEGQPILKSNPEIEKANALLENLNRDMQVFLESRRHNLHLSEDYLKQKGEWEKEVKILNALDEKVSAVQNLFLEFRNNLSEMVALDFGDNSHAYSHFSYSILEVTKWYVKYIEEMLFPRDKGKNN